ncbi:MAG: hypothetical protein OEY38_12255 [Gammaproteobacteria bacterium]|nr:hypothetical protein [Gammaproteobacteria bacterium]
MKQVLIIILFIGSPLSAWAEFHAGLETSLRLSSFTGQYSQVTDENFNSGANQLNLSAQIGYNNFFTGLSLNSGVYQFTERAPLRPHIPLGIQTGLEKVNRFELDAILGWRFFRYFSFFFDVKTLGYDWRGVNSAAAFTGLGIGVGFAYPVARHWVGIVDYGRVRRMRVRSDTGVDNKTGNIRSLNFGVLYRVTKQAFISIRLKNQTLNYSYDGEVRQTHNNGGLAFGFGYHW